MIFRYSLCRIYFSESSPAIPQPQTARQSYPRAFEVVSEINESLSRLESLVVSPVEEESSVAKDKELDETNEAVASTRSAALTNTCREIMGIFASESDFSLPGFV